MLLPTLGLAKKKAAGMACVNNMKQLTTCWIMYAHDHNDKLINNYLGSADAWIDGRFNIRNARDATNHMIIRNCLLFRYNDQLKIYVCPSDKGWDFGRGLVPRNRSYSMNGNVEWVQGPQYPEHTRITQISNPGPSQSLVFVDENEYTIDDAYFAIPVFGAQTSRGWQNSPACRHGDGSALSFADGHAEIWQWVESNTCTIRGHDWTAARNDRDLARIRAAIIESPTR